MIRHYNNGYRQTFTDGNFVLVNGWVFFWRRAVLLTAYSSHTDFVAA